MLLAPLRIFIRDQAFLVFVTMAMLRLESDVTDKNTMQRCLMSLNQTTGHAEQSVACAKSAFVDGECVFGKFNITTMLRNKSRMIPKTVRSLVLTSSEKMVLAPLIKSQVLEPLATSALPTALNNIVVIIQRLQIDII